MSCQNNIIWFRIDSYGVTVSTAQWPSDSYVVRAFILNISVKINFSSQQNAILVVHLVRGMLQENRVLIGIKQTPFSLKYIMNE